MEDFKKTSNLSENTEKTDSENTKKGGIRNLNIYEPNGEAVDVTADTHNAVILVKQVSPYHTHILYVNGNVAVNQLEHKLTKPGTCKIEVSLIDVNGTETKLKKVNKIDECIDPKTNLKTAYFIFFNANNKDPNIIIEMSDNT